MQTIQFKVLNTDTQETNVQMQTENTEAGNKAQNTQNTEVSGVESTEESAGTKKKTTVSRTDRSYGCGKCQMGCRFAVKKMCL